MRSWPRHLGEGARPWNNQNNWEKSRHGRPRFRLGGYARLRLRLFGAEAVFVVRRRLRAAGLAADVDLRLRLVVFLVLDAEVDVLRLLVVFFVAVLRLLFGAAEVEVRRLLFGAAEVDVLRLRLFGAAEVAVLRLVVRLLVVVLRVVFLAEVRFLETAFLLVAIANSPMSWFFYRTAKHYYTI